MSRTKEKFVRRPDYASGDLTEAEKVAMAEHVKLWTRRAFRTEPINHEKIGAAIGDLYRAANLKVPRVVVVPSPFVMAFAGGFAAAIWYLRKKGEFATWAATEAATRIATEAATRAATWAATGVHVSPERRQCETNDAGAARQHDRRCVRQATDLLGADRMSTPMRRCPQCGQYLHEGHTKECNWLDLPDLAGREMALAEPDAVDYTHCECCATSYEQGHSDGWRQGYQEGFLQGVKERS